ncbi:thioredoxin domain-containing protein 5 [Moniliophthora roreri MCA 2997]|uniref:Thioredoxin domain-containing protein 5 n=2 Tax=Moniliophthora roreri TaxID=221103 RepID=V2X1X3_MONRO|nr:thioredoxin domain-containing protein 5 [Moniliophthora roreri MCA 2997]KAI3603567.1 thioredoxin domain-containing protein 5 [Moniliophthora roreri]
MGWLWKLSLYLSASTTLLASLALPVSTKELEPGNFKTTIEKGVWFIEHYSPYCSHCKRFKPTWDMLVQENESQSNPGVRLAQVNCAVHGDLCNENDVTGYPQLNLYRDGEFVETFEGRREADLLREFLKKHAHPDPEPETTTPPAEEEPKQPVRPPLNPTGEVLVLDPSNFHRTLELGPTFVKFYAPWCGHCKKLAPTWLSLAHSLQNKLNVAEVNCEAHSSLCTAEDVQGYPTLIYYTAGSKTEYNGGRKLEQLKAFAEKASGSASISVTPEELDKQVEREDVVYALLYQSSETGLVSALSPLFLPLLGSPTIVTVRDPPQPLLERLSLPTTSQWHLVALKDHDMNTPAAAYSSSLTATALADKERSKAISEWLFDNRLPTTIELTRDTFQSVMNAPSKPLVVVAAMSSHNQDKVRSKMEEIGRRWRARTHGSGVALGKKAERRVVFARMDVEKWQDWMKSMYGVKPKKSHELEDVDVFIADHQNLQYANTDPEGSQLRLTDASSIFSALEGVVNGKVNWHNSENVVERTARYLNAKLTSIETYVVNNPMHAVFFVMAVAAVVVMALRRLLADDPMDRYEKRDRLD